MNNKNILHLILFIFALLAGGARTAAQTPAGGVMQTRAHLVDASKEYKATTEELLRMQEAEVERAAARLEQLRQLYAEGLLAKKELEEEEQALAGLRSKLEATRGQVAAAAEAIKEAEAALEAAKNPPVKKASPPLTLVAATGPAPFWTTGNSTIDNLIRHHGGRHGVDPYLIYCVIHQESGFRAASVSPAGAQGLMQLMPATAARFGVTNPFDPAQNISGGTRYLKYLLELFDGRVDLALAGYNAGEGAVMRYGNRVPPYSETQNYVRVITARYAKLRV
ncbi:MAG TPA: lytic transglycosylase domain-containing protein [Pyrinomonadaceae bacterium]|nr:lytic transglycosylase domain-containing protein [Pyrinomonadaceae bacterium]